MATRNESKAKTDVLEMLRQDHRKAKRAFSDFEKLGAEERERYEAIFEQLAHAKIDWEALLQEMQQRRGELMEEIGLAREAASTAPANGTDGRHAERSESGVSD